VINKNIQEFIRNFTLRQTLIRSGMSTGEPSIEEKLKEMIIKQLGERREHGYT
jgi:hypothetical protein